MGVSTTGRGVFAAAAGLVVALSALVGGPWSAEAASQSGEPGASLGGRAPEEMLLRLHDLPPGYLIRALGGESDSSQTDAEQDVLCDAIHPADPQPKLAEWIERFTPRGCATVYVQIYRAEAERPAPLLVGTGALDAGSPAAAEAGLAVAGELLSHIVEGEPLRTATPAETVGDATLLFHWHPPAFLRNSSFLVWRSGSRLAAVLVAGGSIAANDRDALELAQRQQRHVERPTPYTAAERYDTEVVLDAPWLKVPVEWLGREFEPRHGLAPLLLADVTTRSGRYAGSRTPLVILGYTHGVFVASWKQAHWRSPGSVGLDDRWSWTCTRSREMRFGRGRAVLFAAYRKDFARCPRRRPRHFSALVQTGGTAVAVEVSGCTRCEPQYRSDGYASFRGLQAIVRGLRLRPKPVY